MRGTICAAAAPPAGGRPPREIRVCTHTTCRKQGSPTILKLARDLAPPNVTVSETGCLGGCGAGPNVALLGGAATEAAGLPGVVANHVATAGALFGALRDAGIADVADVLQAATAARLAGNNDARLGNFSGAIEHYSRGLDAARSDAEGKADSAIPLLLANRSGARLAAGDAVGAAADADAAVAAGPPGWVTARVRVVEARAALNDAAGVAAALADLEACGPEGVELAKQLGGNKVKAVG